jgi:VWFA-related protein
MTGCKLILSATLVGPLLSPGTTVRADQQKPSFRSSVDLVRVSAVVRDKNGRFVSNLTAKDFEIYDGNELQRITDFHHDKPGVSVALVMDVSGSMEGRLDASREAANSLLALMDPARDEAAVFTFDTRLEEAQPFMFGLKSLPARLSAITPFGATSLHDAIADTATRLTTREGLRRAVVVFTDGSDNWSRLTPAEAAAAASTIDVPVYIVGIVPFIDNPTSDLRALTNERLALNSTMLNVAAWTGGRSFNASTQMDRVVIARQILDELRHQYLIAFQASSRAGWHQLSVRTRDRDLIVRARSGYNAGQSRPIS